MKIILFNPQIPQNTGNIARTCALTGVPLGIVLPMGFVISDKTVKRAGLDYWDEVTLFYIEDLARYLEQQTASFYFFSSKATISYTSAAFDPDSILIFGSETTGLPSLFFEKWPDRFLKIPMRKQGGRCLNLATSVGIALFEAGRQINFPWMET